MVHGIVYILSNVQAAVKLITCSKFSVSLFIPVLMSYFFLPFGGCLLHSSWSLACSFLLEFYQICSFSSESSWMNLPMHFHLRPLFTVQPLAFGILWVTFGMRFIGFLGVDGEKIQQFLVALLGSFCWATGSGMSTQEKKSLFSKLPRVSWPLIRPPPFLNDAEIESLIRICIS